MERWSRRRWRGRWCPAEMTQAPVLDERIRAGPVRGRYALLVNPFYPKDPNASFGKHVLTPTLALTSFAANTPPEWRGEDWDENLPQGPPPARPMPQGGGISVQVTFAAPGLPPADWVRRGRKE